MRMALALAAVAVSGCDLAFGLHGRDPDAAAEPDVPLDEPPPIDAASCSKNPGLADEDGDEFPNLCDNCPHVAQAAQLDEDVDGVGDACDPRRGEDDSIEYFDAFDGPSTDLTLVPPEGWVIDGGQVVASGVAAGVDRIARLERPLRDVTVVSQLSVSNPNSLPESAGVWANIETDAAFPRGVVFEMFRAGMGPQCHLVHTMNLPAISADCPVPNAELFVVGRPYTMTLTCQGVASPSCTARIEYIATSGAPASVPLSINATIVTARTGLRVHSVDAAFRYFLVIRHGP